MIRLLIILLLFIAQSAGAQLATGSGTIEDPWQIWYLEDLAAIQTNQPGCFKMMADLDFDDPASYESGVVNTAWTTGTGWTPFNVTDCFLDGNNKTISNLYSNQALSSGFFDNFHAAVATTTAIIKDITITNISATAGGGGAAFVFNSIRYGAVDNLTISNADIFGPNSARVISLLRDGDFSNIALNNIAAETTLANAPSAGLVSLLSNATLSNTSIASITVNTSSTAAGAIISQASNSIIHGMTGGNITISNGYTGTQIGHTSGAFYATPGSLIKNVELTGVTIGANRGAAAGLICLTIGATIENCSAESVITVDTTAGSATEYRGGLIAKMSGGSASQCYAVATITAVAGQWVYQGGLVGEVSNSAQISDSYSSGGTITKSTTSGNSGGFAGFVATGVSVSDCYAANTGANLYGFSGFFQSGAVASGCYYDSDLAAFATPAATGKTTAEMYQQATFSGWDFASIWSIEEGADYPRLQWALPEPEPPSIKFGIGTLKFSTNGALKFGGIE